MHGEPKAWRIERGLYELIEDPEDSADSQRSQREEGNRIYKKIFTHHNNAKASPIAM